jgi:hypothetical protein
VLGVARVAHVGHCASIQSLMINASLLALSPPLTIIRQVGRGFNDLYARGNEEANSRLRALMINDYGKFDEWGVVNRSF